MDSKPFEEAANKLRITYQFNRENHHFAMMIVFDEYNRESKQGYLTPLIVGVVLMGISVYPLSQTNIILSFPHLIFFTGLFFALLSFFMFRSRSQQKREYVRRINKESDLIEQVDATLTFEFSHEGLYSEGQGNYTFLLWREIDRYYLKEEHIILVYNNGTLYPLSKLDLGTENFEKVKSRLIKIYADVPKETAKAQLKKSNELLDD